MNDTVKIPRLIIVVPDADILHYVRKFAAENDDVQLFIEGALNWIINQMACTVEAKILYVEKWLVR